MAGEMLAGLKSAEVEGLGLYPDQFRHPVGFRKPLASPRDFKGARIRVLTSNASDALIRALGAEPVHLNGNAYQQAISDGTLTGVDASLGLAPALHGSILTGNLIFYPKVDTLFAGQGALGKLDSSQQEALRTAAQRTVAHVLEDLPATEDTGPFCSGGGRVVAATDRDTRALEAAAQPVYRQFEERSANGCAYHSDPSSEGRDSSSGAADGSVGIRCPPVRRRRKFQKELTPRSPQGRTPCA